MLLISIHLFIIVNHCLYHSHRGRPINFDNEEPGSTKRVYRLPCWLLTRSICRPLTFFCQLQEFDLTIKRPWRGNTNLPTEKKKKRRKRNGPDLSRAIIERDRKENRDKTVDEYFSEDQGWELWGGKGRVSVEGTAGKGRVVDFVSRRRNEEIDVP